MDYIINGGNKLYGELPVYGAKNCALALLGATLLTDDVVTLTNCAEMTDVQNMLLILESLGKRVCRSGETVTVEGPVVSTQISAERAKLLRGSALVLGSAISRCHRVFLPSTGGCAIGKRPIDIHLDGLREMGVSVVENSDGVLCDGVPKGCNYRLRFASVGATENLLCAAVLAQGMTVLSNCALEPEVVALEEMLCQMGAKIEGIGTATLQIEGVKRLHGATFRVIPDRIVACTYLACAAAARGKIAVTYCQPAHFEAFLDILSERFNVSVFSDAVEIAVNDYPHDYGNIVTAPYPAFPTDIQQIVLSLCACSNGGTSHITERLFEDRLLHNAIQLNKMGAAVTVLDNVAESVGKKLHGASVIARDLRGGAGLVVAALAAQGQTEICGAQHVLRGYSRLDEYLKSVGADVSLR